MAFYACLHVCFCLVVRSLAFEANGKWTKAGEYTHTHIRMRLSDILLTAEHYAQRMPLKYKLVYLLLKCISSNPVNIYS